MKYAKTLEYLSQMPNLDYPKLYSHLIYLVKLNNGQTINHHIFCLTYETMKWLCMFLITSTGKVRMYTELKCNMQIPFLCKNVRQRKIWQKSIQNQNMTSMEKSSIPTKATTKICLGKTLREPNPSYYRTLRIISAQSRSGNLHEGSRYYV